MIAVDTALALFEVNWIRGEIPVHHGVAVPVKVEPLLSDGSGTQHKRPKGRVECGTDGVQVLTCLLIRAADAIIRIAACEVLTHSERFAPNTVPFPLPLSHIQRPGSELKRLAQGLHERGSVRLAAPVFANDVKVLLEHGG